MMGVVVYNMEMTNGWKLPHHQRPQSLLSNSLVLIFVRLRLINFEPSTTMKFASLIGAALLAQQAIAHPGESAEQHAKDAAERRAYLNANKRSLAHCADALKKRGNDIAMHQRRAAQVEKARAKRTISTEKPYLRVRDVDDVLNTDHHSNLTGITVDSDPSILFSGNNSCILSPEVTQGPYWVQGELVREDITDNQEGIPFTLDIQIIDVKTCKPVPEAFLEIWHCNSTGVYSGVIANGNGNSNDSSNLDNTFNRGIQKSDEDGVVTFQTTFPGHYTGRAVSPATPAFVALTDNFETDTHPRHDIPRRHRQCQ
jgi:hypothetical protein